MGKLNILYISHLTTNMAQGPNYSVPAQVKSQFKYDNVYWWNVSWRFLPEWTKLSYFHQKKDSDKLSIKLLPSPFNNPDLVIFESFYYYEDIFLSSECRRRKIPYIIIPRSAFTKTGQKQRKLKKLIANFLVFKKISKNALSIQYLSKNEQIDSGTSWNKSSFIMPNGIDSKQKILRNYNKTSFNGSFIGRFDPYQKGLDILVDACFQSRDLLRKNNCTITLYGPERLGNKENYSKIVEEKGISDIVKFGDGVFGENKKAVLINSDFFILTSRFEGMPMSVIEALSYGLPCIVSKGTNMSEDITKNNAGWIGTTVDDVSKAFREIFINNDKLSTYSDNAYSLSQQYDWNKIAEQTHEVYIKLLNKE